MHIVDALTIILIVSWLVNLTPGWLAFVPAAVAIGVEARRLSRENPDA